VKRFDHRRRLCESIAWSLGSNRDILASMITMPARDNKPIFHRSLSIWKSIVS
jgi:hypothetical protein